MLLRQHATRWNPALLLTLFGFLFCLPDVLYAQAFAPARVVAVWHENPPDWAVGTFQGYNSLHESQVQIVIMSDGSVTVYARNKQGGLLQTGGNSTGYYSRGRLQLANGTYLLENAGSGIRMTQLDDRRNSFIYTRAGGVPGSGGVPSWAVGTFRGRNNRYRSDVEVRIDDNGFARAHSRNDRGVEANEEGRYNGSRSLTLGPNTYDLEQTNSGIRLTQRNDRRNRAEYARNGNGSDSNNGAVVGSTFPDWAIGTFRGVNGKFNEDVEWTNTRLGVVHVRIKPRNDNRWRRNVVSRLRDGRVVVEGRTYFIEPKGSNIKVTQIDDHSNWSEFKR